MPSTLRDHLLWQLGAVPMAAECQAAAELLIGNLNEDGYLQATEDELVALWAAERGQKDEDARACVRAAHGLLLRLDPPGVGARDLRECLLIQLTLARGALRAPEAVVLTAEVIARDHLMLLQRRDPRDLIRLLRRPAEEVQAAVELIRKLDPRPGQRFQQSETRLIEPDVAFVLRDDDWVVVMNDEHVPSLRLNQSYRRMMHKTGVEREVRDYVKERYRSAIQLLRNLEQRKNTILRTCEVIVRRQRDFLEVGVEGLRPMMIKEVAEEIGMHPSTVSRAVANKYVHTQQGVYELRFFFSEGVNGPEGGDLPLMLLKRKVRKLIEDEDARKPLTDDALAVELQRQGIQVTRRTVAKYREEMSIPSTHQRRRR